MKCEQLLDLLPLHAVDETSIEDALCVEEHLESCDSCRQAFADYRTIVTTAARDLAPVPATPSELPSTTMVEVGSRAAWGWWSPRLAAAAGLLLAGILFGRWSAESPTTTLPLGPTTAVQAVGTRPSPPPRRLRAAPLSVFSPAARSYLRRLAHEEQAGAVPL